MTNSLIILAHQDDEIAIFAQIMRLVKQQHLVWVIYMTTGTMDAIRSEVRCRESLISLMKLGVSRGRIIFLGDKYQIADKSLCINLELAANGLLEVINAVIGKPDRLYFLAWEGGHPDHDAVHLLGVWLAKTFDIINRSYQFSLYNGADLPCLRRVRLFYPLVSNGSVSSYRIAWTDRFMGLKLVLGYHSQFTTLLWLFPMLVYQYVFNGYQKLQPISSERVLCKPHQSMLRYEQNGFYSYEQFKRDTDVFLQKYLG